MFPKDVFVGRREELAALSELIDEAQAGRGQLVAISGEPGIGKTRLSRAAAEITAGKGFLVVWGRCHEGQYVHPYGPWKQIIREILEALSASDQRAGLAAFVSPLTALFPETAADQEKTPRETPDLGRLHVIDAILGVLREASSLQPLHVVLDNFHCAASSSQEALEALAQEMSAWKLFVSFAFREGALPAAGRMREMLGVLADQASFSRLPLRRLNGDEVHDYLKVCVGTAPSKGILRAVLRRTEGNPLFVSEVVKLVGRDALLGKLTGAAGNARHLQIPHKVRLAIFGRLQRLSDGCRTALMLASVIGREFDAALLADLLGPEAASLDKILDEALAEGWIEEVSGFPGRCRFTHALIQETVESLVSTHKRPGLCLRIGNSMERRHGAYRDRYAGELARYFDGAGSEGIEKAVGYYLLAGENALSLCSYDDAHDAFSRAAAIGEGGIASTELAKLLFGLGRSQHGRGEFAGAVESIGRAFDLFLQNGDLERAYGALSQPYLLAWRGNGARELLERAISLAGPSSPNADRLGFHYGLTLYHETGDADAAGAVFDRALGYARRAKDRILEARILTNWSRVILFEQDFTRAQEMARQAIELAAGEREYWAEATAQWQYVIALLSLGRVEEAETAAAELSRLSATLRSRFWVDQVRDLSRLLVRQKGHWKNAQDDFREPDVSRIYFRHLSFVPVILIQVERGHAAKGLQAFQKVVDASALSIEANFWKATYCLLVPYLSWVTGTTPAPGGEPEMVRQAREMGGLSRAEKTDISAALGLLAALRGDRAAAVRIYGELQGRHDVLLDPFIGLSADHMLGILAQASGDPQLACAHYATAADFCRGAGLRLELAYTCHDHAELLMGTGRLSDLGKAGLLNAEATEIAERGGMTVLLDRLAHQREKMGKRGTRVLRYPDALTRREGEILLLLPEGLSNEQIGEHLFISPRTVANHVQHILEKTGCSNRTEAAVYAVQHGLTRPAGN